MGQKPIILTSIECNATLKELTEAAGDAFVVRGRAEHAGAKSPLLSYIKDPYVVAVAVACQRTAQHCVIEAIEMLESVRAARPAVRRILISDHDDLSGVVESIHGGLVHGVIYRPIAMRDLRDSLRPSTASAGEMIASSANLAGH